MTENEMLGWHLGLDGDEFEQALAVGEGQESLVCCSPWGHKETLLTQMTEQQQQQPESHLWSLHAASGDAAPEESSPRGRFTSK